jgi:hypothetical protein
MIGSPRPFHRVAHQVEPAVAQPLGRRQMRPIGDGLVLADTRYLAILDAPVRGWPDTNDVQRRLFSKFESKDSPFGQGQIEQSLVACPIGAQYVAQQRSFMANHGQPFPLHVRKTPSQSLTGFVFQAGHASSILVTAQSIAPSQLSFPSAQSIRTSDDKNRERHFRAYGAKRYASGHARVRYTRPRRSWVHRPESRRLARSAVNVSNLRCSCDSN